MPHTPKVPLPIPEARDRAAIARRLAGDAVGLAVLFGAALPLVLLACGTTDFDVSITPSPAGLILTLDEDEYDKPTRALRVVEVLEGYGFLCEARKDGARLGYEQSGTRFWTIYAQVA